MAVVAKDQGGTRGHTGCDGSEMTALFFNGFVVALFERMLERPHASFAVPFGPDSDDVAPDGGEAFLHI